MKGPLSRMPGTWGVSVSMCVPKSNFKVTKKKPSRDEYS